jgi:hypothetical protein
MQEKPKRQCAVSIAIAVADVRSFLSITILAASALSAVMPKNGQSAPDNILLKKSSHLKVS